MMVYQVRALPRPHYKMVIFRDSVPRDRYAFNSVRDVSRYVDHGMKRAKMLYNMAASDIPEYLEPAPIQPSWLDKVLSRWLRGQ